MPGKKESALDTVTSWVQEKRTNKADSLAFYYIYCVSCIPDSEFYERFCRVPQFDVTEIGVRKEFIKMESLFLSGSEEDYRACPLAEFFVHYKAYARDLTPVEAADALSRRLVTRARSLRRTRRLLGGSIGRWVSPKHCASFT